MNYSVIIPSRSASNLVPCIEAIRRHEPKASIAVIDDGVLWPSVNLASPTSPLTVIPGRKPFIFARNCNLGINATGENDVILLNDDAMLGTPCGFEILSQLAHTHPDFGVISAVTNLAGNPRQRPSQQSKAGLREEMRTVAFVCVYIPRRAIELVGLLDERFTRYGWEDNDYCRRVRNAGLKIGIFDGCFVDHSSLKSTFRGGAFVAGDISAGREIYRQKWGDAN